VREGEQATAQNAAGIPERIRNLYNSALAGERLSPNQRADFVGQAGRQFKQVQQQQRGLYNVYAQRAERGKLNPADVVIDYDQVFGWGEPPKKEDAATPSKGAPAAAQQGATGPSKAVKGANGWVIEIP
jgi:hypothetical protein